MTILMHHLGSLQGGTKWKNHIGRVLRSEGTNEAQSDGVLLQGDCTSPYSCMVRKHGWSWMLTFKQFRSFHSRVGRHLTGRHIRLLEDSSWLFLSTHGWWTWRCSFYLDQAISCRRQTVRSFTRHRPLYEACRQSKALATNINKAVWWQLEV